MFTEFKLFFNFYLITIVLLNKHDFQGQLYFLLSGNLLFIITLRIYLENHHFKKLRIFVFIYINKHVEIALRLYKKFRQRGKSLNEKMKIHN